MLFSAEPIRATDRLLRPSSRPADWPRRVPRATLVADMHARLRRARSLGNRTEIPQLPGAREAARSLAPTGSARRLGCVLALVALGAVSLARQAGAQGRTKPVDPRLDSLFPERPTAYLTDVAGVVRDPAAVDARYAAIRNSLRLPLVAVTLPSTRGYLPYEVAMEIGRKWTVALANDTLGAATRHTGAVVLLVLDTHECFIATAYGTEGYLTDTEAHAICRAQSPAFRAGDFGRGLIAIGDSLAAHAAVDLSTAPTAPSSSQVIAPPAKDGRLPFLFALIVIVAGVATATFFNARRRRAAERMRWARLTPAERKAERKAQRVAEREARRRRVALAADDEEARRRSMPPTDFGIASGPSFDIASPDASPDPGPSLGGSDAFGGGGGGGSWDS